MEGIVEHVVVITNSCNRADNQSSTLHATEITEAVVVGCTRTMA